MAVVKLKLYSVLILAEVWVVAFDIFSYAFELFVCSC